MMKDLTERKAVYLDDAIEALEKVARLFPYRIPGKRDTYDRYNEAWNDAVGRAEIEIEALPSAQQWIPCSEKLPEDDVDVLVYLFERSSPYIAWVEDCRWYTEDFEVEKENYPTAWQPLPEPYRGGDT